MLLRNKRVIERPNRLVMAANNVSSRIKNADNIEMIMTTASPQIDKTVGPRSELEKEHGQEIEKGECSEDDVLIVGPNIRTLSKQII